MLHIWFNHDLYLFEEVCYVPNLQDVLTFEVFHLYLTGEHANEEASGYTHGAIQHGQAIGEKLVECLTFKVFHLYLTGEYANEEAFGYTHGAIQF